MERPVGMVARVEVLVTVHVPEDLLEHGPLQDFTQDGEDATGL